MVLVAVVMLLAVSGSVVAVEVVSTAAVLVIGVPGADDALEVTRSVMTTLVPAGIAPPTRLHLTTPPTIDWLHVAGATGHAGCGEVVPAGMASVIVGVASLGPLLVTWIV